jgi:O-antigen/teichoic acid export membrane protein
VIITGLNLLALLVNTRALGVSTLGVLIVIQATSELASSLTSFQTSQAMMRFGAQPWTQNQFAELRSLYRYLLVLDITAASVAGVVTLVLVVAFGALFALDEHSRTLAAVYAVSLFFQATGASIGALRLTERFGLVSVLGVITAMALLVNALLLAALRAPLDTYVVTIAAITTIGGLATILVAAARLEGLVRRPQEERGEPVTRLNRKAVLRFALATSASGAIMGLGQRGEVLIISSILGPAAAGLYGVAFRVAALASRIGDVGRQAAYPEIAMAAGRGDPDLARSITLKATGAAALVAIPLFIGLLMFGGTLLVVAFGEQYEPAYPSLVWLGGATCLYACGFALGPYVQIVYGAGRYLWLTILSFAGFLLGAVAGPLLFGLAGAGIGRLILMAILFSLLLVAAIRLAPAVSPAKLGAHAADAKPQVGTETS